MMERIHRPQNSSSQASSAPKQKKPKFGLASFTDERYHQPSVFNPITPKEGSYKYTGSNWFEKGMPIYPPSPEVSDGFVPDLQQKIPDNALTCQQVESEEETESVVPLDGEIQTKCTECSTENSDNSSIQTKLTISTPGDKYEQEADMMAAKVMAMPESAIAHQVDEKKQTSPILSPSQDITDSFQRQGISNAEIVLQKQERQLSPQASSSIESRLASTKGGGSPLPDDVRNFMEPRFGADFSTVRVHTDSTAVQMNKELGAKAFAHGNNIYYGAGYSPAKDDLTAHELTHNLQQTGIKQINKDTLFKVKQEKILQAKELKINLEQISLNKEPFHKSQLSALEEPVQAKELSALTPQLNLNKEQTQQFLNGEEEITRTAKEILSQSSILTENRQRHQNLESEGESTQQESLQAKEIIENKSTQPKGNTNPPIQNNGLKQNENKSETEQIREAKERIASLLSNDANLANLIGRDPVGFLKKLSEGLSLGFKNFQTNIRTHLQNALISWLTGTLQSNIQMPPNGTPTIKGFFSIVLQVLGFNGAYIRSKAIRLLGGEARVRLIENSVPPIFNTVKQQPMEMWNVVQNQIRSHQNTLIEQIKNAVITAVIAKVIEIFLSLLSPVSGLLIALRKIYDILKFFIQRCNQIMELVNAVVAAVSAIAAGKVEGIALSVETALSRSLPVLIGTLAASLGIERIADRIRNMINRIRARIDGAIDYFLNYVNRQYLSGNRRNGNRRQNSFGGQDNSNRRQIVVPEQNKRFEMYGRSHTLYMYLRNGLCGVDIASRREYFENVIKRVIGILEDRHGRGSRTEPLPALRNFLEQLKNYQEEINMAARRASTQAEVINEMHKRLDRMAEQLKNMGNRHQIADLQQFRYQSIYSSGGELRLEYRSNIRDRFYGDFTETSKNNKRRLVAIAKAIARTKPGYNNIPAADRKYIYWCEDRGSPPLWTGHLADDRKKNEKPELDHIETVSHHWKTLGYNQTQAQRVSWYNTTSNHQAICKHHNASKGGERITDFNVGSNFRGPGE